MQSMLCGYGTHIIGYMAGCKWFAWSGHISALSTAVSLPVYMAGMWLHGPAFTSSIVYLAVSLVQFPSLSITAAVTLTGPSRFSLFNSRLITLMVLGLVTFCLTVAGLMAPVASAMPDKPHTSLAAPIMTAGDITMRFMNAYSDISIVRIIMDQVLHLWRDDHGCMLHRCFCRRVTH